MIDRTELYGLIERIEALEKSISDLQEEVRNGMVEIFANVEGAGEWLDGLDEAVIEIAKRVGVDYVGQGEMAALDTEVEEVEYDGTVLKNRPEVDTDSEAYEDDDEVFVDDEEEEGDEDE